MNRWDWVVVACGVLTALGLVWAVTMTLIAVLP